jgi:hypothetical protein
MPRSDQSTAPNRCTQYSLATLSKKSRTSTRTRPRLFHYVEERRPVGLILRVFPNHRSVSQRTLRSLQKPIRQAHEPPALVAPLVR